jgi:transposase
MRVGTSSNRGEDWVVFATTLGIKYKTAFHWVRSGREVMLKKGGMKPKALVEDEINAIVEWVEDDCGLTLKQVKEKVLENFRKNVSTSTIGNYLEGSLFTMKQVHKQPISMNSEENKRKRAEYVAALNRYIELGKQIVWIDETNFNLFCRRNRGRSRTGVRAVQHLPAARGPNVHLIGAISAAGIVTMERRRGSFSSDSANIWITNLLQRWQEMGNEVADLVIVCDNAPCHARFEGVINNTEATLLHLEPYSPMLNPIENIWSKIKTYAKTHLRVPQVRGIGVVEQRLLYLEQIIDLAKGGDCARAAQHTTIFHAASLAMQYMQVGH